MPETKVANRHIGVCAKSKSGDESVTSSTTSQNDDHLVFDIGANETWLIQYDLFINIGGSTNFKHKFTVPSGASIATHAKIASSNTGADVSDGTSDSTLALSGFATNPAHIQIFAKVTSSSTPGSVQLQWAQGTSSGTALTLKSRSRLLAVRE